MAEGAEFRIRKEFERVLDRKPTANVEAVSESNQSRAGIVRFLRYGGEKVGQEKMWDKIRHQQKKT